MDSVLISIKGEGHEEATHKTRNKYYQSSKGRRDGWISWTIWGLSPADYEFELEKESIIYKFRK